MVSLGLAACATVVSTALANLIWTGYLYSAQFDVCGAWDGYAPGLQQGWLFGRRIDLSDTQWREFRSSAPYLVAVLVAYAVLSRLVQRVVMAARLRQKRDDDDDGVVRARALFCVLFAAVFLTYLHGYAVVYVFILVSMNWGLAQAVAGTRFGAVMVWMFNVASLFIARLTDGFPLSLLLGSRFQWLEQHRGVMRWQICYNLTVLRMLSFALDLHWSRCSSSQAQIPKSKNDAEKNPLLRSSHTEPDAEPSSSHSQQNGTEITKTTPKTTSREKLNTAPKLSSSSSFSSVPQHNAIAAHPQTAKQRQTTPLPGGPSTDYGLLYALAHAVYPPLYVAGPIITYQDFVWQIKYSSSDAAVSVTETTTTTTTTTTSTVTTARRYVWRLAADVICIELLTHFLYFNSLAVHRIGQKYTPYGLHYTAPEVGLTAWWVLSFMWLKFSVLWRTFRLSSLLEGVDPPENMLRCFANNYDIEGFWKGWHASYNRWLVRYMYVPCGGSRYRFLSIWPIFLFVAVWHDLEWRLVSWAWLICVAFLPELIVKQVAAGQRFDKVRHKGGFTAVAAGLAALNCAGLMAANMVGFVVGADGMSDLFRQLFASPQYLVAVLVSFYCAMHLNFAWRRQQHS